MEGMSGERRQVLGEGLEHVGYFGFALLGRPVLDLFAGGKEEVAEVGAPRLQGIGECPLFVGERNGLAVQDVSGSIEGGSMGRDRWGVVFQQYYAVVGELQDVGPWGYGVG